MGYNEYVTIMAEEVKCPNCEEKDRVTIAGRVFCINCGKPFDDGAHDDLPRPVAPAQPIATSFNTPPNSTSSNPLANTQNTNQRATELQSLINAEPKIIPANSSKTSTGSIDPILPVSPLLSFDRSVDSSTGIADDSTSKPTGSIKDHLSQSRPNQPSTTTMSTISHPNQSLPIGPAPRAAETITPDIPLIAGDNTAQAVASSISTAPAPAMVEQTPMDERTISMDASSATTQPPVTTSSLHEMDKTLPLPYASRPSTPAAATAKPPIPTSNTIPSNNLPFASEVAQTNQAAKPLPIPVQPPAPITHESNSSLSTLAQSSSSPALSILNPAPTQPVAQANSSIKTTPAVPVLSSPEPQTIPAPAQSAQSIAPSMIQVPPTTDVQPPSASIPASATIDQVTSTSVLAINSTEPAATTSQNPITPSALVADNASSIPNDNVPLDLDDKSIMSDDAFDKLLNTPSILSDSVKKVETAAQSNVISSVPPPFTPPPVPLTSANVKILPSQVVSDIKPVAHESSPPTVVSLVPTPQPPQLGYTTQATQPSSAGSTPAQVTTQPRLVSDIKPAPVPSDAPITPPTNGGLNIHPTHSFMAEPGVANRVGGSSTPEQDQATQELALKMALSSAGEQPDPQIGVSFKPANVALSLIAVGLLGFYIWQVNYPNLAIKVAASKSGVTATVPGYLPSGWKIGKSINASDGVLSYDAINPSISKNIKIIQARTAWDSQALAENYVAPKHPDYTAFQVQGLTIYMYDDNKVSWVSNGNWFRIEGQTQALSQDQIIKMATSL